MPLTRIEALTTQRLALRQVSASDLADLAAINGDPQVTQFLPYEAWQSEADGSAWLQRMESLAAAGSAQQLVLARRDDAKVIGTVLLFRFDEISARLELGYVLGRVHWGQGLMREAIVAVCHEAFSKLSIRRIEAEVNPANTASNTLLQRVGFVHEGRLRQRWLSKGEAYDVNVYGLLASEWKPT